MIEVITSGPLTTIQDLGRPGHAATGVGRSGAADATALRLANRIIGNDEGAAALETTLGGLTLRFLTPATVAVTGAPCPVRVDGRAADMNSPLWVPAAATVRLGTPQTGLRSYFSIRGGVAVPPVLGSRSTDLLSGIGPPPLAAGQLLPIGPRPIHWPGVDHVPVASPVAEPRLRLLPGPRADWFAADSLETLCGSTYRVSPESNRIALRLRGMPVPRIHGGELPPEGLVPGAVQIPPDGHPIVFLADHPVTGGYPVIAVVRDADICHAAQLRPGQPARFTVQPRLGDHVNRGPRGAQV